MARAGKALVMGDDTRSFLAIVRSLGRKNIDVHAAPFDFSSPALSSKYLAKIHYLPYFTGDGAEWLAAFTALLERETFDLVIPCDERTILPLQRHRLSLSRLTELAMPSDESIAILFDKHETRRLAQSLSVPIARGGTLDTNIQAAEILQRLGSPIFVKPRRSYTIDNLYKRAKVRVIHSREELDAEIARGDPSPRIYEQLFAGRGIGVSVLASNGRILQYFEHHRAREIAGSSYYRVSAPVTADLASACSRVVAALDYTGVAMFEFRLDDTSGEWILLEVNARPWGSLPLPVALGVDFPYRWFELLVHGRETSEQSYQAGIYGRNLLPDIRDMVASKSGARNAGGGIKEAGREFARIVGGREREDVFVGDDPAPAFHEINTAVAGIAGRIARKVPASGVPRRAVATYRLNHAVEMARRKPLRIVFLCHGNICRSPFAARLLERELSNADGLCAVEIVSAGILPRSGRPSPDTAVQVARNFGIDLTTHTSRHLDRALAEQADVIFVFDEKNRSALTQRYPTLRAPVLSLASFSRVPQLEDPDGEGTEVFASVYRRIERGVHAVAKQLKAMVCRTSEGRVESGVPPEYTAPSDAARTNL